MRVCNGLDRGCNITPDRKEKADFFWVLYEKKQNLGIKSEDKLDGVNNGNKRTEETVRELEPD